MIAAELEARKAARRLEEPRLYDAAVTAARSWIAEGRSFRLAELRTEARRLRTIQREACIAHLRKCGRSQAEAEAIVDGKLEAAA